MENTAVMLRSSVLIMQSCDVPPRYAIDWGSIYTHGHICKEVEVCVGRAQRPLDSTMQGCELPENGKPDKISAARSSRRQTCQRLRTAYEDTGCVREAARQYSAGVRRRTCVSPRGCQAAKWAQMVALQRPAGALQQAQQASGASARPAVQLRPVPASRCFQQCSSRAASRGVLFSSVQIALLGRGERSHSCKSFPEQHVGCRKAGLGRLAPCLGMPGVGTLADLQYKCTA